MINEKVRPHHLECKATLSVRQSSAHQVLHNRESSTLQYAMRDRLTELGWSKIEVIDDIISISRLSRTTATRPGACLATRPSTGSSRTQSTAAPTPKVRQPWRPGSAAMV